MRDIFIDKVFLPLVKTEPFLTQRENSVHDFVAKVPEMAGLEQ
jgi:hypothetical protein